MDISPTSFAIDHKTQSLFWKPSNDVHKLQSLLAKLAPLDQGDLSDDDSSFNEEVPESTEPAAKPEVVEEVTISESEQKKAATPAITRVPKPTKMILDTFAAAMSVRENNPFGDSKNEVWDGYSRYDHEYCPTGAYSTEEML